MRKIKEIPLRKRLATYKKALRFLTKDDKKYGLCNEDGLCLVLMCVHYNLNCFLDDLPNGDCWSISDTETVFPEFGKYLHTKKYRCENGYRVSILKKIISKMESK